MISPQLARPFVRPLYTIDAERVTAPVLLWECPALDPRTGSQPTKVARSPLLDVARDNGPLVFAIEKRFEDGEPMIMLGRSQSCDVVIADASVSRHHACFEYDAGSDAWLLADQGSSNGTCAYGQRLRAGVAAVLVDGARLRFGNVEVAFFLPSTFRSYLAGQL